MKSTTKAYAFLAVAGSLLVGVPTLHFILSTYQGRTVGETLIERDGKAWRVTYEEGTNTHSAGSLLHQNEITAYSRGITFQGYDSVGEQRIDFDSSTPPAEGELERVIKKEGRHKKIIPTKEEEVVVNELYNVARRNLWEARQREE